MAEREILFRGKRLHDNKWIYGDFVSDCEGNPHIIEPRFFCEDGHHLQYEDNTDTPVFIIPETVGQYTGLTDKNGVKIFEGDIVKAFSRYDTQHTYAITYRNGVFWFGVWNFVEFIDRFQFAEVIGNIHDDSDMIEGGGDNG